MGRKEFNELLEELIQKKNSLIKKSVSEDNEKVRQRMLRQIDAQIGHLKLLQ